MINIQYTTNGDLELYCSPAKLRQLKSWHAQQQEANKSIIEIERQFIIDFLNEYGFIGIMPDDCGALTDAPLIQDLTTNHVYGYMDYQLYNFVSKISDGETVTWTKG